MKTIITDIKDAARFDSIVSDAIQNAITKSKDLKIAKRWENAIDRAVKEITENPYLTFDDMTGHLLVLSPSGACYEANGDCQCEAFRAGTPCWHRAAARLLKRYFEKPVAPVVVAEPADFYYRAPEKAAFNIGGIRIV